MEAGLLAIYKTWTSEFGNTEHKSIPILERHIVAEERFQTWSLEDGDVKFVFSEFKKTRAGCSKPD